LLSYSNRNYFFARNHGLLRKRQNFELFVPISKLNLRIKSKVHVFIALTFAATPYRGPSNKFLITTDREVKKRLRSTVLNTFVSAALDYREQMNPEFSGKAKN